MNRREHDRPREFQRGPAPADNPGDDPNANCQPKPTDAEDQQQGKQDHKPPCPEGYEDRQPSGKPNQ